MTAIESKEEISDTDSGIILHSGKDFTEEEHNALSIQHLIPGNWLFFNFETDTN